MIKYAQNYVQYILYKLIIIIIWYTDNTFFSSLVISVTE